jgi:hypothetical protein
MILASFNDELMGFLLWPRGVFMIEITTRHLRSRLAASNGNHPKDSNTVEN